MIWPTKIEVQNHFLVMTLNQILMALFTSQACDCSYCDDFSENTDCANTCRVMNGFFSSPYPEHPWAPVWVTDPKDADDGTSCAWMQGNGDGGHGDDCKQCDEYAMKCRRATPPQLGATYSQNRGGNCKAW